MASDRPQRPDAYLLGRDFKSASRLNYQHYLWYETLRFHLAPTIIANLSAPIGQSDSPPEQLQLQPQKSVRIADVACGSGAWLRSVAHELPDASFDGFDLSLSQCPPVQWLPHNIRLREWDLFKEPTEDMLGVYDIVHTRLIFTVIQNEDARPVIRNLMRLLKPGGWLQWDELDVEHSYVKRVQARAAATAAAGDEPQGEAPTIERMLGRLVQMGRWVTKLPASMQECGMVEVDMKEFEELEELAQAFFDNNLAKDEEMATNALGGTEQGQKLLEMVLKMHQESKRGVVICTPKVVCTARKAPTNMVGVATAE